ncbi:MAG: hypothetical protein UIG59_04210 [Acutalibacteraceae bacterium]|nr:hypothetical protein [Acutalibacteraceae bacterium]
MSRKLNLKIILISLLAAVLLIALVIDNSVKKGPESPSTDPVNETRYFVKIEDDSVCLVKNNDIIKTYEIDITLLPGDDILTLMQGIEVKNPAEADLLAEDFDG